MFSVIVLKSDDLFSHRRHSHPLRLPRDRFSSVLCKFNRKNLDFHLRVTPKMVSPVSSLSGMVRVWVALCYRLVTRGPYLSALEIRSLYIKRYINSPSLPLLSLPRPLVAPLYCT